MIQEVKTYNTKDLGLEVNNNYNPAILDISEFDRYLTVLCQNRFYQKEAIEIAIIFLASQQYNSIEDLVRENYKNPIKADLQSKYRNVDEYIKKLQMSSKLTANIDLATGTGKSYVIYAIAQIMLSLGIVNKVLVLCPSLTIERELRRKFIELSSNSSLQNCLPINSKYKNPSITNGNDTIIDGSICIENIHAVYERTKSSISDSLKGCGENTLVLNDESHHIYNANSDKDIKKWRKFLLDDEYKFKYILGFTGTAYIENEYFNDVIYRYSLRQAIDDKMVKMIDYVSKDDSSSDNERYQKILDNHKQSIFENPTIKPLSLMVTKDIISAKRLASDFIDFLMKKDNLSRECAENKVIVVTSSPEHITNVLKLPNVDDKSEAAEWIVSVSMLTEGWDVKNVFQIVPWEDRAFNSKLLIAQVLGRGLRIPSNYQVQPKVRVFNHSSFSRSIKTLVEEVLEIEMKLFSEVILDGERSKFNFNVKNMKYDKKPQIKESNKETIIFDYTKGYIKLVADLEIDNKETEYEDIKGKIDIKKTLIKYDVLTIDEIVNKMYSDLKKREWEGKILKLTSGEYSKDCMPPKDEIRKIIRTSMDMVGLVGDNLTEINSQRILTMFSTLLRKKNKSVVNKREITEPIENLTTSIEKESLSVGNLRRDCTVFYSNNFNSDLEEYQKDILQAVIDDDSFVKSASKQINSFLFKTPINIVFTKGAPEREFVKKLCDKENAKWIKSWIKSRNQRFYSIEYTITTSGGKHSVTHEFNPDFFIKLNKNNIEYTIVVEIKADGDNSEENKAKYKYANDYFEDLNKQLEKNLTKEKYIFHFLSPINYGVFFDYLKNGQLLEGKFKGILEDLLDE